MGGLPGLSAGGPAGKFLRVQSKQEACVFPVWLELGEWLVGDDVGELAWMARGW